MNKPLHIVELLGRRGFPIAESLYGQNILKLDLLKYLNFTDHPYQWHLMGANIAHNLENIHIRVHNIDPSAWLEHGAYVQNIENLCQTGEPVVVISSFTHEEHDQVIAVGRLKKVYENLTLIVVLHCPLEELIRDVNTINDVFEFGSASWQNASTLGWIKLFKENQIEELVDTWVAVSDDVAESFAHSPQQYIPSGKLRIITNGINEHVYRPLDPSRKKQKKVRLGLSSGPVVGTTVGYKQVKGDLILREIFAHYALTNDDVQILLPVLPDYPGKRLLDELVKDDLLPLLAKNKLFLCFDAAKWNGFADWPQIEDHYNRMFNDLIRRYTSEQQVLLRSAWIGVLDFPMQQLIDIYLRPSLSEAFGRGSAEAGLCGNTLIVSDRGYMKEYSRAENVIHLPGVLTLQHKSANISKNFRDVSEQVAKEFIRRITKNINRHEKDVPLNRLICLKHCPTLTQMVAEWQNLISEQAYKGIPA